MEDKGRGIRRSWISGLGVLLAVIGLLRICYPPSKPSDMPPVQRRSEMNNLTPEEREQVQIAIEKEIAKIEAQNRYRDRDGEWGLPDKRLRSSE